MLNSTKTWQEEFYKKFNYIQAVKNEQSGNSYNRITEFISNLRKRDMEALIKMFEQNISSDGFFSLNQVKFILQDYYAK